MLLIKLINNGVTLLPYAPKKIFLVIVFFCQEKSLRIFEVWRLELLSLGIGVASSDYFFRVQITVFTEIKSDDSRICFFRCRFNHQGKIEIFIRQGFVVTLAHCLDKLFCSVRFLNFNL